MIPATLMQAPNPALIVYEGGRPIGQIIDPRSERVIGRGQGTVLLKR